ncbi:hypothetical protein G6F53_014018 [Rhizopus delemar]|nr:hypothetical protein G6F53_014018 [Rhizopus delemar]
MQTVLITGASSGYGHATANHFLQQGWNVIATMRRPDPALFAPSERLRVVELDVTDDASIARAIREGIQAFGWIDALVNNASNFFPTPLGQVTADAMAELRAASST